MNEIERAAGSLKKEHVYGSVTELATELGISRQSAYAALNTGAIPSIRLGRRFVIPRAAVQEWLRAAGK